MKTLIVEDKFKSTLYLLTAPSVNDFVIDLPTIGKDART